MAKRRTTDSRTSGATTRTKKQARDFKTVAVKVRVSPAQKLRDQLRAWREGANLTDRELARRLGLDELSVTCMEDGSRPLDLAEIAARGAACGVSTKDLAKLAGQVVKLRKDQSRLGMVKSHLLPGDEHVGQLLRAWREAAMLKTRVLSHVFGETHIHASYVETGRRRICPLGLLDWSTACGVSAAEAGRQLVNIYNTAEPRRRRQQNKYRQVGSAEQVREILCGWSGGERASSAQRSQRDVRHVENEARRFDLHELIKRAAACKVPIDKVAAVCQQARAINQWNGRCGWSRGLPKPGDAPLCDQLTQWREQARVEPDDLSLTLCGPQGLAEAIEAGSRRITPLELLDWSTACGVEPAKAVEAVVALHGKHLTDRRAEWNEPQSYEPPRRVEVGPGRRSLHPQLPRTR